jgi:membrane-bound metal-dependent hydrolase YbcI (DUF457 family)
MVDIVHHSLIGLGGALVSQQLGNVDAAVGFLIGSLLPDLDVVFMALGKSKYLRLHQSVTHSVFVLPFLSMFVGVLIALGLGAIWYEVALGCLVGALVHVALDMMNSFGVRATWPSPRRYSVDAFFFIDIYVLAASGAAVFALWFNYSALIVCSVWLSSLAIYCVAKVWWRSKIVIETGAETAIPSGVSPLFYYLTRPLPGGGIQVGHSRGLGRSVVWEAKTPYVNDGVMAIIRSGPVYKDLEEALKLFRPVLVELNSRGDVVAVVSRCVAVRNFKNRYGEIRSTVSEGKLVDEVAYL